jgi:hypothetical protein
VYFITALNKSTKYIRKKFQYFSKYFGTLMAHIRIKEYRAKQGRGILIMKKLLIAIATLVIMPLITYIVVNFLNINFIDYAFLIALIMTAIIWFSSSKGGLTSNYTNGMVQSQTTNFKMTKEKFEFTPTIVFFTAVGYTIFILIMTIYYYKDYFFS